MNCVDLKLSHNRCQRPAINLALRSESRCIDSDVFKVNNLDVVIGHPEFKLKVTENGCATASRHGDYVSKLVSLHKLAISGNFVLKQKQPTYETDRQVVFHRRPAEVLVDQNIFQKTRERVFLLVNSELAPGDDSNLIGLQ